MGEPERSHGALGSSPCSCNEVHCSSFAVTQPRSPSSERSPRHHSHFLSSSRKTRARQRDRLPLPASRERGPQGPGGPDLVMLRPVHRASGVSGADSDSGLKPSRCGEDPSSPPRLWPRAALELPGVGPASERYTEHEADAAPENSSLQVPVPGKAPRQAPGRLDAGLRAGASHCPHPG